MENSLQKSAAIWFVVAIILAILLAIVYEGKNSLESDIRKMQQEHSWEVESAEERGYSEGYREGYSEGYGEGYYDGYYDGENRLPYAG